MRSSCIKHPEDEPLIIIRQWQLEFCNGNEVSAALMSFFEYWHNVKLNAKSQNKKANEVANLHGDVSPFNTNLYQWHTEKDLIAGIQRIAKTGKTLTKSLEYLEGTGVVTIHENPNPHYKFDKTRHFLFHPEIANEWLSHRTSKNTPSTSKNTLALGKNPLPLSKNTSAIPETTTETTTERETTLSANADCGFPISLLSEKEIKDLKLPLSGWKQHLADEQAERGRKGIIAFLEKKISTGPLLPDTPDSHLLFEKLTIEAEARGRCPPSKFPTLACKTKFTEAAGRLNGTLETAIDSGLEQGITAIPKLVSYVASPKWQQKGETTNERERTKNSQRGAVGQTQRIGHRDPLIGSGQTPEMREKLRNLFPQ